MLPALIVLVAAVLRIYLIDQLPPGFQHDENQYGLDALDVLDGKRAVWFERNVGREPLWIYLLALAYGIFGPGLVLQHALAALIGTLTVAIAYPVTKAMLGRNVALLTSAFFAITYWHVHISRIGFRVITLPLLVTIAFGLLWWALQRERRWDYAAAGAALGLTLYTYYSARVAPLVPLLFVIYLLLFHRKVLLARWSHLLIYGACAAIVFAPLGAYLATHPAAASDRLEQTFTLLPLLQSGDPVPFIRHALRTLGMFSFQGDVIWRYNLSGRPVFDWVTSALFYLGIGLAIIRWRQPQYAFILLWTGVLILPGLLTDESPHFLRNLGIMPAIFMFPAIALVWIGERVAGRIPRGVFSAAVAVLLVAVGAQTARDYFVTWANAEPVRVQFRADLTRLAEYLESHPTSDPRYISVEYPYDIDRYQMQFLMGGVMPQATWFDGRHSIPVPPAGPVRYFFPAFAAPPYRVFENLLPSARLVDFLQEETGRASLWAFHAETVPPPAPRPAGSSAPLRILEVDAPTAIVAGDPAQVTVLWQIDDVSQTSPDQTFFLHLLGPWDSLWAQQDFSAYPPEQWQNGDRLLNIYTIETDPATAPGTYRLVAGSYRRDGLERTPIWYQDAADTVAVLGEIEVAAPVKPSTAIPNNERPAGVSFGNEIRLLSFAVDKPIAAAGEQLGVTLRWQAQRDDLPDYTVFVHLYDADGNLRAQRDSQPVYGSLPTTRWQQGQVVLDRYDLQLPEDLPPGQYRIAIGVYAREGGARLPVQDIPSGLQARLLSLLERTPWGPDFRAEADRVLLRPVTIRAR